MAEYIKGKGLTIYDQSAWDRFAAKATETIDDEVLKKYTPESLGGYVKGY